MSGSTVALELQKNKEFEVVIMDCDTILNRFDYDKVLDKEIKNTEKTIGYGFGGTSNLWHGVIAKLDDEDFSYIDRKLKLDANLKNIYSSFKSRLKVYFGNLDHLDLNKYNCKSHNLLKYIDLCKLSLKPHVVQKIPTRFRSLIRDTLNLKHNNFQIIENTVALSLNIGENNCIESVTYSQDGIIKAFHADVFVVATGAIESPRIAYQSFHGSEYYNSLIGTKLTNHPVSIIAQLKLPRYMFYTHHGSRSIFSFSTSRMGFTIPNKLRKKSELNHSIFIRPDYSDNSKKLIKNTQKILFENFSIRMLFSIIINKELFLTSLSLISERLGFGLFVNKFIISVQLEQVPSPESYVEIIDKYDKYGRMLPKVHELSNVNILRDIKNIKTIIRKLIKSESGAKIKEIDSQILNGGSHYAGTCCMGCNKKNGVVDKNLKYFGINNLYICDASVIPKIGNANLSLTIVSLAIRLSDHLSNKYKRMV